MLRAIRPAGSMLEPVDIPTGTCRQRSVASGGRRGVTGGAPSACSAQDPILVMLD